MSNYKYFFQTNRYGDPIPGSNIRTTRPPRSLGKTRWKEFVPKFKACCDVPEELETSEGRRIRYYIRVSDTGVPISGTLTRHDRVPPTFAWQEVVGMYCCVTAPQFTSNPLTISTFDPTYAGNIITLAGGTEPQGGSVTVFDPTGISQDNMTIAFPDATGAITVNQDTPTSHTTNTSSFDVVTTDGHGHHTTLHVVFNYQNLPVVVTPFTSAMVAAATSNINIKTLSSATDPESQAITIVESGLVSGDNGSITLTITNQATGAATLTYVSGSSVTTLFTVHLSDGVNSTALVITATHN